VKLADFFDREIRDAIAGALKDDEELLTRIAEAGGKAAGSGTLDDIGTLSDILSALLGPLGLALGLVDPPVAALEAVDKAAGKQGRSFAFGYAAGYAIWQLLQPAVIPLQHSINDLLQTEIFDPQTAAELEAQGIIDNAYGRSEAAGNNLSGEHYDKLVDAAQLRPELLQTLDLWNRGVIQEADVDTVLRHHKVPQFWWDKLKFLRRNLLSPADLALNNLRGEMSEQDAQQYAAVLGVIPEDFKRLVQNTGEPPGPEQMMEALRRGFVDHERFVRAIRQSRVRDEWIDVMYDLRQSPMSTADAVRAVVEHYLTDDQGKEIAVQNGLMPEHWEPMRESWGRPLSHEQMLSLYHRGEVTLDDVQQAFRESDMKDKYFKWSVLLGETLVPQRQITSMLQHGVIDKQTAHAWLRKLGYDDAAAQALIDLGAAEHKTALHTLTKTDIVTAYVDSLMTHQEALNHLVKLGYNEVDAKELLQLAEVKQHATAMRTLQRGIEASLKAHHLTEQEARQQLVKAGMTGDQATALVDQWLQQRGQPTRSLTEAQILKLAEYELITVQQARDRLIAYGLVAGDADLLLMLHGLIPTGGLTRGGQQPVINAPPKATPGPPPQGPT